mmetsp:Transcript_3145/g.7379  ORF Transcript_3145/g.7379 Transcript_3145/m.7379 type:complete len:106 (+) Transcript_3145:2033-2350(+)
MILVEELSLWLSCYRHFHVVRKSRMLWWPCRDSQVACRKRRSLQCPKLFLDRRYCRGMRFGDSQVTGREKELMSKLERPMAKLLPTSLNHTRRWGHGLIREILSN